MSITRPNNTPSWEEEWRPVVGYEGLYDVSSYGQVRNLRTSPPKLVKQQTWQGYKRVWLLKEGKGRTFGAHRLVAFAFIPLIEGKNFVNHKDLDRGNNHVENLEWCTPLENTRHAISMGVPIRPLWEKCKYGHDLEGNRMARGRCKTCNAREMRIRRRQYVRAARDKLCKIRGSFDTKEAASESLGVPRIRISRVYQCKGCSKWHTTKLGVVIDKMAGSPKYQANIIKAIDGGKG